MHYTKIIFEARDEKTFTQKIKELLKSDKKAQDLYKEYTQEADKLVDYIDYVMGKYEKKLDQWMKEYDITYNKAVDILSKGI